MAIFNITNNKNVPPPLTVFTTDNININIDTLELTISEIEITEEEWLGNF